MAERKKGVNHPATRTRHAGDRAPDASRLIEEIAGHQHTCGDKVDDDGGPRRHVQSFRNGGC